MHGIACSCQQRFSHQSFTPAEPGAKLHEHNIGKLHGHESWHLVRFVTCYAGIAGSPSPKSPESPGYSPGSPSPKSPESPGYSPGSPSPTQSPGGLLCTLDACMASHVHASKCLAIRALLQLSQVQRCTRLAFGSFSDMLCWHCRISSTQVPRKPWLQPRLTFTQVPRRPWLQPKLSFTQVTHTKPRWVALYFGCMHGIACSCQQECSHQSFTPAEPGAMLHEHNIGKLHGHESWHLVRFVTCYAGMAGSPSPKSPESPGYSPGSPSPKSPGGPGSAQAPPVPGGPGSPTPSPKSPTQSPGGLLCTLDACMASLVHASKCLAIRALLQLSQVQSCMSTT